MGIGITRPKLRTTRRRHPKGVAAGLFDGEQGAACGPGRCAPTRAGEGLQSALYVKKAGRMACGGPGSRAGCRARRIPYQRSRPGRFAARAEAFSKGDISKRRHPPKGSILKKKAFPKRGIPPTKGSPPKKIAGPEFRPRDPHAAKGLKKVEKAEKSCADQNARA